MTVDLTQGKPDKVLLKYSLPLFGSIIFQQLYNFADSFVAGKFIGEHALAAVGNSYEITLVYLAFAFGCNMGSSVVIARLFGEKKYNDMKTAVSTAFITTLATCFILMILGFTLTPHLLHLMNTPEKTFKDTMLYLNVYTGGLIFLFLYNVTTGIFASLGDSNTPFIFLAISSVANIFMDILFVKEFHMGVGGVAWATFICQSISCIVSVIVLFRVLAKIKCEGKRKHFSLPIFKRILMIAIPSTLQQSFVSVGNILIQSIINGYGTSAMAGYAAAVKFNNFTITSFVTFGNAMSNFTAQNLGANSSKRVTDGYKASIRIVWAVGAVFIAAYLLFTNQLIHVFMNSDSQKSIKIGIQFLRIVSPFYLIVAVKLLSDGVLRGAGKITEFMIATLTDLAFRVVLSFIMSAEFGLKGIWLSWPIGWILSCAISFYFYKRKDWAKKVSLT